jgi:hypothetical protein
VIRADERRAWPFGAHADPRERTAAWVAIGMGALLALPVLVFRYPPMGDLAFHESLVSILRHFGDARFFPEGLYEVRVGQPNELFHAVAWALSFVVPTDLACKLVVFACIALAPVATARLAAHFGRSSWSAVLVLPVMLGWMFRWGLVTNLVGFIVLLFALVPLDRLANEPTLTRALYATALAFVVYLGHESTMVVYAVASVVFALQTPRRASSLLLAACPGAAAALLAATFAVRAPALAQASVRTIAQVTLPAGDKLESLPTTLFGVKDASLVLVLGVAVAIVLLHIQTRPNRDPAAPPSGAPEALASRRLAILAALTFVLYLAMPLTLGGSTLIHQRFLAPAFALAVVASVPRSGVKTPKWTPLILGFPLAILALTMPDFIEQDRNYRDLDVVLEKIENKSAVAQLDLDPRPPSVVAPVVGAAARALAVHGGRLLFSFSDAPQAPIQIQKGVAWNEPVLRLANAPYAFMPDHDLRRFRYVLVWLEDRRLEPALTSAFAPEADLVVHKGMWLLFESRLPLAPLTSPDEPLPSPAPETLRERMDRVGVAR